MPKRVGRKGFDQIKNMFFNKICFRTGLCYVLSHHRNRNGLKEERDSTYHMIEVDERDLSSGREFPVFVNHQAVGSKKRIAQSGHLVQITHDSMVFLQQTSKSVREKRRHVAKIIDSEARWLC